MFVDDLAIAKMNARNLRKAISQEDREGVFFEAWPAVISLERVIFELEVERAYLQKVRFERWVLIWIIILASLIGSLYFSVAKAQPWSLADEGLPRMVVLPGKDECDAIVKVYNLKGWYSKVETLHTEVGDVVIRYVTRGHHGPGQDDKLEVQSVPESYAARPWETPIEDGVAIEVCIFRPSLM